MNTTTTLTPTMVAQHAVGVTRVCGRWTVWAVHNGVDKVIGEGPDTWSDDTGEFRSWPLDRRPGHQIFGSR